MLTWVFFAIGVILLLALDLGVFHREPHRISAAEAGRWTVVWVSLALLFALAVWALYDHGYVANLNQLTPGQATLKYLMGYLLEISLSMDNLFVIAVIFRSFRIPREYQHRVLFWGILGAVVMRTLMIFLGVALIHRFAFMTYIFGAFLLFTAVRMLRDHGEGKEGGPWIQRLLYRAIPTTDKVEGQQFFVRVNRVLHATPLFVALLMVEFTDLVFAIDSIPAVLAVTTDPFLVLTSNVMAILGLRSMYFFLADMMDRFHLLKYVMVVLLFFVGLKMLLAEVVHLPEWASLMFIASALTVGILLSVRQSRQEGGV